MGERQYISKSLRYDIFARDGFTCQYCGRKPPVVILQIDHRIPVSKGGTNDPLNLLSSCEDCNGGKSAKIPGEGSPTADAEALRLRVIQESLEYENYVATQAQREAVLREVVNALRSQWKVATGGQEYVPSDATLSRWVGTFGVDIVDEAIRRSGTGQAIRYVSGIMVRLSRGE